MFGIITARKRSFGKIMFLNVSVILSRGGLPTGSFCLRGSAYRGGLPTEGGVGQSSPSPMQNQKEERYASYWNAALFYYEEFVQKYISWKSEKEVHKSL